MLSHLTTSVSYIGGMIGLQLIFVNNIDFIQVYYMRLSSFDIRIINNKSLATLMFLN